MKTQKDLSPQQKQSWLKAVSAMEQKNFPYVIQICQTLLQSMPDFLDGRKLARKAAIEKSKTIKKGFFSGLGGGSSMALMKAGGLKRKDDLLALLPLLEEILADDPFNAQANTFLQEAALKWDPPMKELAFFAFETTLEGNPKDKVQINRYASFCMERDENGKPRDPARAVELYNKLLAINPNDMVAMKGSKDASASQSVQQGGWEVADSYRDLIKNKEEAVSLEQQSRVVKSDEMIDNQIAELSAAVQAEPQSVDKSRKVAELYEQKGDLENSLEWYRYVLGLSGGADTTISRKISDLQLRQIDDAFTAREEYLASSPDDPEAPRYREEMDELRKQRASFVLAEARERVDRNPTDLIAHFDLGVALMDAGEPQDAIGHFQRARMNPSIRLKAMGKLGQCYVARNMNDLAAKTLSDAVSELVGMDSVKKDLLYNLGSVYRSMNETEKAVECFKQIYEVDYGYRDVAQLVESSYGQG
ncbi:MAG: tetratricopeptide repeat protein [Verrucomicrobia bacterium]|nr:tetratricopeptide repeat protein [Verrucomicrobiota bacterium]